ncbi:MAG: 4-hydroxybenzoate octaprenyltransferase [Rhizobiales bacterium]|nr:4-hydroxybenzoate octaprenyltransferase [Hyphomicrobiales bacterium]MBI3672148.1 4-hydroxybenzoate octaprenyltransferase [Hyphomicrobiales bacterium]
MSDADSRDGRVADAVRGHWADRLLPEAVRPYARLARLERPIGWWLLLIPCWWGLLLAQIAQGSGWPNLWYALLFLIGSIVMRGAGCTLNDIVDRDFDAQVARTRSRPIPSGQVSVPAAIVFLVALSLAGLAVLLQFNRFTIALGAASLVIVAIYPLMKRVTYWPQLFLGLAFNWGALVGWSAVAGSLSLPPLLLYAAGICWTLAYDTIYAHQDKEDDVLIGVKSTALKFGTASRGWIALFFAAFLILTDAALWLAGAGPIAHMGVAAAALHAAWQVTRFADNDAERCLKLFRSNRNLGLIITFALLLDLLIP